MKKHRLKNYLKLGILLFGVFIATISCDKDDTTSYNQVPVLSNSTEFKIQRITNPPISQNKELSEKLSSFNSKKNTSNLNYQAREAYNAELDFTIDTDISNYIEYGEYHSYTFPIKRTEDNGLVENLLLSLQINGTYKAYLVAYNLTEEEKLQIQNNENIDLSDKTTFTILQDQDWANSLFARIGNNGICHEWITITPRCTFGGEHSAEDRETGNNGGFQCAANFVAEPYTISSFTECPEGGGGGFNPTDPTGPLYDDYGNPYGNLGGGNNDGSTSSNPNSNDNNDNSNDGTQGENTDCLQADANGNCPGDMTAVIIRGNDDNDCKKLKEDITDVPLIKTRLHTMKVDGEFAEKGLRVDIHPTTGKYTPTQVLNDNNATAHIKIPVNPYTVVIAHTHPPSDDDYYAMFSGPDIIKMGQIIKYVQSAFTQVVNPVEITHILIADGKTFALRFDDADSVQNLLDIYENKDKRKNFIKDLHDNYDSDNSGSPLHQSTTTIAKQQQHIFNLLADNNLNMSMYEANYNDNGFINDWQKINPETLQKENCN